VICFWVKCDASERGSRYTSFGDSVCLGCKSYKSFILRSKGAIYLFIYSTYVGKLFLKLDGGSCDRCTSLVKLLVS
jgi:hypothetical protein